MPDTANQPVVLVTGSARRIGAEIVRHFHRAGYRVIIHCHRSLNEAQALADTLNGERADSVQVLQADLTNHQAVLTLADQALDCFGRLDVLVNNASLFFPTPLADATGDDWDQLINSNVKAAYFLSQQLVPALRQQSGCIISIADMNADRGMANYSLYTMAKSALQSMSRSLARELAPDIRVNCVSPGAILWPEQMSDASVYANEQATVLAGIPVGRLGAASDIASAVFFLVSKGSYITGQTLTVDGGRSLA